MLYLIIIGMVLILFAKGKNLAEKQYFIFKKLLKIYESVILIGIDIPQLEKTYKKCF